MNKIKQLLKNPYLQVIALILVFSSFTNLVFKNLAANTKAEITKLEKPHRLYMPDPAPAQATVMITNREMNSGGTGIILRSSRGNSEVLTNNHVCNVVKNGGNIISHGGVYQVQRYVPSEVSDLCILTVFDDLRYNNVISKDAPHMYDRVVVSGHPRLMPNILTTGHISGRNTIEVLTGFKQCTEDDLHGPNALFCVFLGGIPILRSYESVLVSATIMPGSSGSGVYNSENELIGVVFAGSGDLGYAWTVPYEQLVNFVDVEAPKTSPKTIDQTVSFGGARSEAKNVDIKIIRKKCQTVTDPKLEDICNVVARDVVWMK